MSGADFVTVVSGLPRSGTSLAMRMLEAGGWPLQVDAARPADPDNPRGYYEYAPVKAIRRDTSWVAAARGRAVKVVCPLVFALPVGFAYRVVWMRRPLEELLASQRAMLRRRGAPEAEQDEARLAELFRAQERELRDWLGARAGIRSLALDYPSLCADPRPAARALADLVDAPLDVVAMAACVEPALYRQRGGESVPLALP